MCHFRTGNQCELASRLAGCSVPVTHQACRACQQQQPPRDVNCITISLAVSAARHDPERVQQLLRLDGVTVGPLASPLPPTALSGPGTELHRLLASLGVEPREGCGCENRMAEMDRQGAKWCRENLDEIVQWLVDEAQERRFLGVLTRLVPGGARLAARRLVLQAIKRHEAADS